MDASELYREAVKCLTVAATECQKVHGWNLPLILRNCQQCSELVSVIREMSTHPLCTSALDQLRITLANHCVILETKLKQRQGGSSNVETDVDVAQQRRQTAVQKTILMPSSRQQIVHFDDIAGLTDAKQTLQEAIMFPLLYPHLFTGGCKPWKSVLLFGPPGTGKSRLACALSAEVPSTFYSVSSADLMSHWVGESEKQVKELFEHAISQPNQSVIFIDEVDGLCRHRASSEEEHTRRFKTELLKQIEIATSSNVFLLCATNCPWELDAAFRRRFQKCIYVPLPDWTARSQLFKMHVQGSDTSLSDEEWNVLIDKTDNYSGSDIRAVVIGALYEPIRNMHSAQYWKINFDSSYSPCEEDDDGALRLDLSEIPASKVHPRPVCFNDFMRSLTSYKPTVKKCELQKYEEFIQM